MSQTEIQLIKDAVIVNADVSNSAAIDVSKISGVMPLAGGTFTDDVTFTGASANLVFDKSANALEFADNAKAAFGTGTDLLIYHNGSNSVIRAGGSGQLNIESSSNSSIVMGNADLAETIFKGHVNGAVELYHDNSKKFQTYSNGIQFFGNIKNETDGTNQGMFLGAANDFQFYHDGNRSAVNNRTGDLRLLGSGNIILGRADSGNSTAYDEQYISCNSNGAVELYHDNSKRFESTSAGVEVFGELQMDDGNSHIKLIDGARIDIGSSADLQIFHSGGENFIRGNASTSAMFIDCCNELQIRHLDTNGSNSEKMIVCNDDGSVELYNDNSKKLHTHSAGVNIEGNIIIDHTAGTDGKGEIAFGETGRPFIDGFDNGNHGSGAGFDFRAGNGDYFIKTRQDAAVELYYDNTKRLETTSLGAKTSGRIEQFSADNNTSFRRDVYYLAIPTQTTKTITLTTLNGTGVFRAGGYTNAGQGALALHVLFGGAMFATQHYQVNELINSGMQNTSISTSKNSTNYTIAITNSSTTFSLILGITLESTGSTMGYAVA